jgi:hypothetical protein
VVGGANSIASAGRNNSVRNHHYYTKKQRQSGGGQAQQPPHSMLPLPLTDSLAGKKSIAISNASGQSKSIILKNNDVTGLQTAGSTAPINTVTPATNTMNTTASPSVSFMVTARNTSLMGSVAVDSDVNSEANPNGSFSVIGAFDRHNRAGGGSRQAPMHSMFSSFNGVRGGGGGFSRTQVAYKYEQEFQELQFILLWFPEEVALRLTEVEYELFRQIPPMEYLRHATLDMNNFKTVAADNSASNAGKLKQANSVNSASESCTGSVSGNNNHTSSGVGSHQPTTKCVQDLITRYKEVRQSLFFCLF